MQLLTSILMTCRRWSVYGRIHAELSACTERELADIGIKRGEIRDVALRAGRDLRATALQVRRPEKRKAFAVRIAPAS